MYRKKLRAFALAASLAFFLLSLSACQNGQAGGEEYFAEFKIDAEQLYIDGKKISSSAYSSLNREAGELIRSIEREISLQFSESEICRINAAGANVPVTVGEHTYRMLELCKELFALTDGKFTPALLNLTHLWGFSPAYEGQYNRPRPEPSLQEIQTARAGCDFGDLMLLEGNTVVKKNAALKLDLGGIAKGYMSDCLRALILKRYEGKMVDGSISVMSNIILMGNYRENTAHTRPWRVSIDNPRTLVSEYMQCMRLPSVSSAAVTTSSDMYRFYSYGGKIYCHIIDPATGKPADRGIISITIVVPDSVPSCGALADALSTAGFCMKLTDALSFYGRMGEAFGVSAIVICSDFNFYTVGNVQVENMSDVSAAFTDVFTRKNVADAQDIVIANEREREYISRAGEL